MRVFAKRRILLSWALALLGLAAAKRRGRVGGRPPVIVGEKLEAIIAATDGVQLTGDELATMHHRANVLFNDMRGGVPANGYLVDAEDVRAFVSERSPLTAARCADTLASLPPTLRADELVARAGESRDDDLWRLAME